MSNIDAVNALITAINLDRFAEIEARHLPNVTFHSFRGPILRDSVSVEEWHHQFLESYADCNYGELEYIERGNTVAVRATIEAKGYDWRRFTQRVVEVFELAEDGGVQRRRQYAMLRDIELDKPATAAMNNALEVKGDGLSKTREVAEGFYLALLSGDADAARGFLADKCALVDSVYGIVSGADGILEVLSTIPKPLIGSWRVTNVMGGQRDALVELAIDPTRPRAADWVRVVDGKIGVIEGYWMLREIGVNPFEEYSRDRHSRRAILPI
jgi:hypothetical protein